MHTRDACLLSPIFSARIVMNLFVRRFCCRRHSMNAFAFQILNGNRNETVKRFWDFFAVILISSTFTWCSREFAYVNNSLHISHPSNVNLNIPAQRLSCFIFIAGEELILQFYGLSSTSTTTQCDGFGWGSIPDILRKLSFPLMNNLNQ